MSKFLLNVLYFIRSVEAELLKELRFRLVRPLCFPVDVIQIAFLPRRKVLLTRRSAVCKPLRPSLGSFAAKAPYCEPAIAGCFLKRLKTYRKTLKSG